MVGTFRPSGLLKWLLGVASLPALFSACSDGKPQMAAGAAGQPGSAGQSGSAGNSGTCHAARAATPVATRPSAFDANTVARAAAVIGACIPDDGVARNAGYLWAGQASSSQLYDRFQTQLECLANSACGCAATLNCLGYRAGPVDSCKSGCVGSVFTACGPNSDLKDGFGVALDCQSVGLRCDAAATCIDGAPTACDSSFVNGCTAAGQPEYCDNGLVRHGPTCAELGLSCVAGACTGSGAACTNTIQDPESARAEGSACDGSVLTACAGGKLTQIDCGTRGPGFGCQHVADSFYCGLASECSPPDGRGAATPSTCNGSVLEFCNAGRLDQVDCVSLGFTGCTVDTTHGLYGCTPGIDIP